MKIFFKFLFLFPLCCFSQNTKISGFVKNSKNEPVELAQITLQNQKDTLSVLKTLTDTKGFFEIEKVTNDYFILKVIAATYQNYTEKLAIEKVVISKQIVLQDGPNRLDEVRINSKKPTVKRKIDRIEFNVENTILSANNAWEILKKTPGVTVSGGELSIRGSKGILVTINDKKVYLTGEELKTMLEGANGDAIKLVEVITNPPAKYEAAGSAVLNIKMIKNSSKGYKGTLRTAYVQSIYAKYVASTSQYFKLKKIALSGNYQFGSGTYLRQGEDVVHYQEQQTTWKSVMNRKNKSLSQNTYRFNAVCELDSLNTISFGTDGFISKKNSGNYVVPTTIFNNQNQIESRYITSNKRKPTSDNRSYNLTYEYRFSEKKTLNFSSDFTNYERIENQNVNTLFYFVGTPDYSSRFASSNKQNVKLYSLQLDFNLEKDKTTFETGVKFGNVTANSILIFEELEGDYLVNKPDKSNDFNYNESIFAGYVSLSKEFDKWSIKAGLRSEYTLLEGVSVNPNEENEQKYFKLFPTLYLMYKPSEGNGIGFSYGKRISRPNYGYLNPSKSYYNKYSYFMGDAKLLPTITHNFNILYTLKSKYNFDFYYRYEKNPSMEISYQDNDTNTVVYQFTNIEKDQAVGLDFNCNIDVMSWWTVSLQSGIKYTEDLFLGRDGFLYKNGILGFNGSVNQQFNLNKKKSLTGEVNFWYDSPSVQGTFRISGSSSLEMSCKKKLWNDRAAISLILSDVYRGEKSIVSTNYADQSNYFYDYSDTQSFRVSFRYNLGNQKLKQKEEKGKTEEQKRL